MRIFISRSGRTSYQMPSLASKSLLVCLLLLFSVLLMATYALAGSGSDKRSEVKPAAAAPIPQLIVTGQRMTDEQKRQFDEAEATVQKASATKVAGLQNSQK